MKVKQTAALKKCLHFFSEIILTSEHMYVVIIYTSKCYSVAICRNNSMAPIDQVDVSGKSDFLILLFIFVILSLWLWKL